MSKTTLYPSLLFFVRQPEFFERKYTNILPAFREGMLLDIEVC